MPLPTDKSIVLALRSRVDLYAAAVGFPPPAQRAYWNEKPLRPQPGTRWAAESFTNEPADLNGPRDGGTVTLRGNYIWTLSAGAGDGLSVHDPLDLLKATY